MRPLKNFTATSATLALLTSFAAGAAAPDLTVTQLEGSLLSKATDGTLRVLSIDSSVHEGDVLVSRSGSYAQVRLGEHTQITLGPDTQLMVIKSEHTSRGSAAVLSLSSGSISLNDTPNASSAAELVTLTTPFATITIEHATLVASYRAPTGVATWRRAPVALFASVEAQYQDGWVPVVYHPDSFFAAPTFRLAQNTPVPLGGGMNPGLYVQVLDGAIQLTNGGGTQNFTSGQFGFTPGFQQPPVILPNNPGMQFTPPPSFSTTTGGQNGTSKPGEVDCIVR